MITIIHKGKGRIMREIKDLYRATYKKLPVCGEAVRVSNMFGQQVARGFVTHVDEYSRRFNVRITGYEG